ncbi:hypothetical protein EIN_055130 [Entamoeba invadens IP1]|uniref:hypothetical protein n=1 Tax=Entamoeba invadens IP1 TaxID=370355 RepID=UPI0002C3F401|nr:hypothetical protein EIN_055130 [Entamoeba invadens IP1]ELP93208.1 hypothetical protein EIN_055130 [Entamoeba invadens IP1]|eukprot:XP_004259979.1 hypothetical protein EIN_055130 [Entamoeba invadens IP1]
MSSSSKRIRYKEWKCTFPGCTEGPKTKYNAVSHVWDAHLKFLYADLQGTAYKNLPEQKRKEAKKACMSYIAFVTDTVNQRKRKPYKTGKRSNDTDDECESTSPPKVDSLTPDNLQYTEKCYLPAENVIPSQMSQPVVAVCRDDFLTIQKVNANIKRLCVAGTMMSEGGYLQRSDERYKTEIVRIQSALENIRKIVGYSYYYKTDLSTQKYGFLAQNLQEIYPEAVKVLPDGILSVDMVALLPYIITSMKEIYTEFQHLHKIDDVAEEIKKVIESVLYTETNENALTGLGPQNVVWYIAIFFTLLSLLEVGIFPNYGMVWVWTIITSFLCWLSYWRCDWKDDVTQWCKDRVWNHLKTISNNILKNTEKSSSLPTSTETPNEQMFFEIVIHVVIRWCVIFTVGIVSCALTFLMGATLQIYLSLFLAASILVICLALMFKRTRKLFLYLILFVFLSGALTLLTLVLVQPSYSCVLSSRSVTPSKPYIFVIEQPPWNCMSPSLHTNESSLFMDYRQPYALRADHFNGKIASVKLQCKNGVSFECGNVLLEP